MQWHICAYNWYQNGNDDDQDDHDDGIFISFKDIESIFQNPDRIFIDKLLIIDNIHFWKTKKHFSPHDF